MPPDRTIEVDEYSAPEGGVPHTGVQIVADKPARDLTKVLAMLVGILGFLICAGLSNVPDAVDPQGQRFELDAQGRLVRCLWRGEVAPGERLLTWDGSTDRGRSVAPGVYFLRVRNDAHTVSRSVQRLR